MISGPWAGDYCQREGRDRRRNDIPFTISSRFKDRFLFPKYDLPFHPTLAAMASIQPDRARPSLPDLPVELLKTIVQDLKDLVDDEDENEDWMLELRALSLVSKALTAPCQESLFEVADMEPPKFRFGKDIYRGSDTLSAFPKLIKQSPHLALYIRHFTITFPLNPESKLTGEVGDEIAEALEHITNLAGLPIRHEDETYRKAWAINISAMQASTRFERLGRAIAELLGPRLQYLVLQNVTISVSDLAQCTSLEGLHLRNAGLAESPNTRSVLD